ncbi:MAG: hypothetical protein HY376_02985 [Candidatus Blackburnbacteria bacterium]|nr:hypothetical protein [Candidatus Blackburnbacteria bacterium]
MNLKEFAAAFLIGVGVVWIIELISVLSFKFSWTIPAVPIIGRTGLLGGLAAVLLIWLLKEKKLRFIPISI